MRKECLKGISPVETSFKFSCVESMVRAVEETAPEKFHMANTSIKL